MSGAASPALDRDDEVAGGAPEDGIALCLSGGGYRAMVFHLGALTRLNELGLLRRVARVSSVSGGSVTAGALGLAWRRLDFGPDGVARNLGDLVVAGVRAMADVDVDIGAIVRGILLPGAIGDRVAAAYDRHLYGGATLADLPDDEAGEGPRFVINATNVQTAALWRFSRRYMGDYRTGLVERPRVRLAVAVAASSAFPPVLSPTTLEIAQPVTPTRGADLHRPPYTRRVVLSDGGVYDNLGLETAMKRYATLLVSDGGGKTGPEEDPADDWARHSLRVLDLIDNQVRSLRKRHLIESYQREARGESPERGARQGGYWSVRTRFADYGLSDDPLGCAGRDPSGLAEVPTRLQAMPRDLQERLINWGYAICDAALRRWYLPTLPAGSVPARPPAFPFARGY
jgi:NTE family protein